MFYEHNRSNKTEYFHLSPRMQDFSFPVHLHSSFEFCFVESGSVTVTVNGIPFDTPAGTGTLILPNQLHAYASSSSECSFCIFSIDFLADFYRSISPDKLRNPVIRPHDPAFLSNLQKGQTNHWQLKSLLYHLAACYSEGEPCSELHLENNTLVSRMIAYLEEHYTEPLTLQSVSAALNYNYRYLSGMVNRCFQVPFPQLLNTYRVRRACTLLNENEHSITEISQLCGYDSPRSFNRNFKAVMQLTPREYRQSESRYPLSSFGPISFQKEKSSHV